MEPAELERRPKGWTAAIPASVISCAMTYGLLEFGNLDGRDYLVIFLMFFFVVAVSGFLLGLLINVIMERKNEE